MNPHLIIKLPFMGALLGVLAACGSIQPEPKPVKIVIQGKVLSNCKQVGLSFVCKQPAAPKPAPAEIAQASLPEPEAGDAKQPTPEGDDEPVAAAEVKTEAEATPAPATEPAKTADPTPKAEPAAGDESLADAKAAPATKAKATPVAVAVPQQLNLVSSLQVGVHAQEPQADPVVKAAPQAQQEPVAGKTNVPDQAQEEKPEAGAMAESEAETESKPDEASDAEQKPQQTEPEPKKDNT